MEIKMADIKDAEEILILQKKAYKQEAELYNNYSIQPLTMTIEETRDDFKNHVILKAVESGSITGSVRAYEKDGTCYVDKVIVDPACQNTGKGTAIMKELEKYFPACRRFELYTGYRS